MVLCRHQAYKVQARDLSTASYYNVTFDPTEIVDAIYRPNPTNGRNTIKMYLNETDELAKWGWEVKVINSQVRGRCMSLHYKRTVLMSLNFRVVIVIQITQSKLYYV